MLFILAFLCATTRADDSLLLNMRGLTTEPASSARSTQARFEMSGTSYVSSNQPYFRPGASHDNSDIGVDVDIHRQHGSLQAFLQLKDHYSPTENWNYIDPYQAYASYHLNSNTDVTLGRRLYNYSTWEATWRQGLFQPRYMEDRLNPRTAGLTGAFAQFKTEHHDFLLGSTVLIPDFGTHMYVRDNHFYSANPWFHPPAPSFQLNHEDGDIHYSVLQPTPESVISKVGLVARYEFQFKNYQSRVSYAYKPMPQLLLGFPSARPVQVESDGAVMNVQINARALYHRVYSWDNSLQAGRWNFALSTIYERPDQNLGPEEWTSQQVKPATIVAVQASAPLEEEGPHAARFKVAYMNVDGGDAKDAGPFASRRTLFERRYQYQEGYLVELSKPWRGVIGERALETAARFIYDPLQNGGVASFALGIHIDRNWQASAALDMLGLLGERAVINDGFLSTYRANDQFILGVGYVY
jgi:hypothetical protein